jgi:hypothetical protein
LDFSALDIITPIHSPNRSFFNQQNTLPIGSCALSDSRNVFPLITNKYRGIAKGVTSNPTNTSTSLVPMPEMSLTVPSNGAWFEISASLRLVSNTSNGATFAAIFINGIQLPNFVLGVRIGTGGNSSYTAGSTLVYLTKGTHKIDIYWGVGSGTTGTAATTDRELIVQEK